MEGRTAPSSCTTRTQTNADSNTSPMPTLAAVSYSGRSRAPATGVHSLSFESADAVASKGLVLSG